MKKTIKQIKKELSKCKCGNPLEKNRRTGLYKAYCSRKCMKKLNYFGK